MPFTASGPSLRVAETTNCIAELAFGSTFQSQLSKIIVFKVKMSLLFMFMERMSDA